MSERIIDTHPHIASPDTDRYPLAPIGGVRSDWSKKRAVTFEELVAAMDEAGVTKGTIVHSSTTYGFDNSYVADSIQGHLDRFTGIFSVNVTEPDAPEMMRKWYARGMAGMRMFVRGSTMKGSWLAIDDPVTEPSWRCAAELGITMCVNTIARDEGVTQLENVLTKYPDINVLLDHLGDPILEDGPPYEQAKGFFALARFPNLYLKYTPYSMGIAAKGKATPESFLQRIVGDFGANRVCWGSNFPSSQGTFPEIVAEMRRQISGFSQEEQAWILYRTAETLYPCLRD